MSIASGLRVRADLALNVRRRDWSAQFAKLSDEAKAGLKQAVERNTIRLAAHAKALAPVQRGVQPQGTLKNAIRHIFFDDGMTGSVFVGRMVDPRRVTRMDIKTRAAFGKKRSSKMPIYVEYGTETSGSRPFLLPALQAFYPRFQAECKQAIDGTFRD